MEQPGHPLIRVIPSFQPGRGGAERSDWMAATWIAKDPVR
jgi:hypothetical protein